MPTITKYYRVGAPPGVLTDMTAVVFRDPTGTIGVRRTDTLANVVTPGTALTHVSTGVYSYTFADPLPGLAYDYWVEATAPDGTKIRSEGSIAATFSTAGTYTTQPLIEGIAKLDADIWSQINNDSTAADPTRFTTAINSTEQLFNRRFREAGYVTPITNSSADFGWIQELATKYALTELYFVPRGMRDQTDQVGGQLANLRKWVLDELAGLIAGGIDAAPRIETGSGTRIPFNVFTRRGPLDNGMVPGGWPLVNN